MSAYILGRPEIAYLAEAWARSECFVYHDGVTYDATGDATPTLVGGVLWQANVDAVQYRYNNRPPLPLEALPCRAGDAPFIYEHPDGIMGTVLIDPLLVLSLCANYEYQACELPHYDETLAAAFIDALRRICITNLPGYMDVGTKAPKILQDAL